MFNLQKLEILFLVIVIFVFGNSGNPIVGCWDYYGEQTILNSDGTSELITPEGGKGMWNLSNDTLTIVTNSNIELEGGEISSSTITEIYLVINLSIDTLEIKLLDQDYTNKLIRME